MPGDPRGLRALLFLSSLHSLRRNRSRIKVWCAKGLRPVLFFS